MKLLKELGIPFFAFIIFFIFQSIGSVNELTLLFFIILIIISIKNNSLSQKRNETIYSRLYFWSGDRNWS